MSKQSYVEKLRDPRWQRKRLEVMQAADFKCQDCGTADKTLNVHHSAYEAGREPWEYTVGLRCVCEDCHLMRQETENRVAFLIKSAFSQMDLDEVVKLANELYDRWRNDPRFSRYIKD